MNCKGPIIGGEIVNVPGGTIHGDCFVCPCCGKDLRALKGYVPFKVDSFLYFISLLLSLFFVLFLYCYWFFYFLFILCFYFCLFVIGVMLKMKD